MFGYFFQANSYIGVNEKGEAFAVDIGGEAERFLKYLEENDLKLKMILLTHGHFDHIRGVAEVAENTGAKVYIHSEDASMLTDPEASLARFVGGTEFKAWNDFTEVKDGNVIDFDGTAIKVIHTPGHTKGSVCYFFPVWKMSLVWLKIRIWWICGNPPKNSRGCCAAWKRLCLNWQRRIPIPVNSFCSIRRSSFQNPRRRSGEES